MLKTNVIGIDLAKNVLQICHISKHGELLSNKAVSRQKLKEILAKAHPSIVAMEGCAGCHYWGRYAEQFGHDVRIVNPRKVKGLLEGHKTDANDALAISNTAMQIGLKYSKPKNIEQQSLHTLETSRKFISRSITSMGNHIRAMLFEFGTVSAKGARGLKQSVQDTLDDINPLPEILKSTLALLWNEYLRLRDELKELEKSQKALTRQLEPCRQLMELEGVAEVSAAMLYATIGDGKQFKNGRQASAFIGLTPKQYSSGGKVVMMGINKNGGVKDLRSLLYLGALSYICRLPAIPKTQKQAWLISLVSRLGIKKSCIALANKTVRTAWAMLRYENEYIKTPII